jgi:hypothetical protein
MSLDPSKGTTNRRANILANIIVLTSASNKTITNRAPSDYLKQVTENLGSQLSSALEANLISETAFNAALADDYDAFIEARSKTIAGRVAQLCEW